VQGIEAANNNDLVIIVISAGFLVMSIIIGILWQKLTNKNEDEQELKIQQLAKEKGLSKRELQIFREIPDGNYNKEIGQKFNITENTVKSHRRKIYEKLEVNNIGDIHKLLRETKVSGNGFKK